MCCSTSNMTQKNYNVTKNIINQTSVSEFFGVLSSFLIIVNVKSMNNKIFGMKDCSTIPALRIHFFQGAAMEGVETLLCKRDFKRNQLHA